MWNWKYSPVIITRDLAQPLASSWNLELTQRGADPHTCSRKSPRSSLPVPLARASTRHPREAAPFAVCSGVGVGVGLGIGIGLGLVELGLGLGLG